MPTRYWHPFADMHKDQDHELVLVRGTGAWIEDADGLGISTRRRASGTATSATAGRRSPRLPPTSLRLWPPI